MEEKYQIGGKRKRIISRKDEAEEVVPNGKEIHALIVVDPMLKSLSDSCIRSVRRQGCAWPMDRKPGKVSMRSLPGSAMSVPS